MKTDAECSQCLTVKPILYLSVFITPAGNGEIHECSDCRMQTNYLDCQSHYMPDYIWDHLPRVTKEDWLTRK